MSIASTMGSTGTLGGTVLTGEPKLIIDGQPVAVNGGTFYCPVPDPDGVPHGYQTIIASGAKAIVNGQMIAQMGDSCCRQCGNTLLSNTSKLILS